jgi:hypothetical protein
MILPGFTAEASLRGQLAVFGGKYHSEPSGSQVIQPALEKPWADLRFTREISKDCGPCDCHPVGGYAWRWDCYRQCSETVYPDDQGEKTVTFTYKEPCLRTKLYRRA